MPQKSRPQKTEKTKELVTILSLLKKNALSKKKLFEKLKMEKSQFLSFLGLMAQLNYVKIAGRKGRTTIKISKIGQVALQKMKLKVKKSNGS